MTAARSDFEIATDGRTVWVNAPNCVGRFCKFSAEVVDPDSLHPSNLLTASGESGRTGITEWRWFVDEIARLHGIAVPEDKRPSFALGATS